MIDKNFNIGDTIQAIVINSHDYERGFINVILNKPLRETIENTILIDVFMSNKPFAKVASKCDFETIVTCRIVLTEKYKARSDERMF